MTQKRLGWKPRRHPAFAADKGWSVSKAITEIGSDLDSHRMKLMKKNGVWVKQGGTP